MIRSPELDKTVKLYILSCVDGSAYGKVLSTNQQKSDFLLKTFYAEQHWLIDRDGQHKAMVDWLQGLASALTLEFANHKILDLAILWGSLPMDYSEKQATRILDNYWSFMATRTLQLFSSYGVPKD